VAIPCFRGVDVRRAVPPLTAYDAVRDAFLAYAKGDWTMEPKVYITNYPFGDFRAMPALGGGHALLKWVSSFPGNPARGLPTVSGAVLLSNAETGEVEALLDAAAVTALRTAAAGVIAAEALARPDADGAAVIGCGVNGAETARMLTARGRAPHVWDVDAGRRSAVVAATGATAAASLAAALEQDIVITVTPGAATVIGEGALRFGQHVSLVGADGPGKAEIALAELQKGRLVPDEQEDASAPEPRVRLYCDDWQQASHGGELAAAAERDLISRSDVTELGAVLSGTAPGRQNDRDITLFDSTGLAIQDLAIAIAAFEKAGELELQLIDL
jgi:alanine dehydrogenase